MAGMKSDMGGSAAVLGAFKAIVECNLHVPVHALLCIAENSGVYYIYYLTLFPYALSLFGLIIIVGPLATRPDDIHVLYSGKTVEINNTDAEGRLVLADGCAYASCHLNPKVNSI